MGWGQDAKEVAEMKLPCLVPASSVFHTCWGPGPAPVRGPFLYPHNSQSDSIGHQGSPGREAWPEEVVSLALWDLAATCLHRQGWH